MNKIAIVIPTRSYLLNLAVVGAFLVGALWLITSLMSQGLMPLASALSAISVFIALVYLRRKFTPLRWLGLGLALAMLFTLYPLFYTLYISTTNMGSGHLMPKQQAINRLEQEMYLPENGATYQWTAFQSTDGTSYALWLLDANGTGMLARPAIETIAPGTGIVGELDEDNIPVSIEGYERLPLNRTVPLLTQLSAIDFGEAPNTVRISSLRAAASLLPKYRYDAAQDAIIDQETGDIYRPIEGTFTSDSGDELAIGYIEFIGTRHFQNFLGNEGFREPLLSMLVWDITFAFCSVLFSFGVGLIVTILFDDLPGSASSVPCSSSLGQFLS
ncbi:MAG: hypothetical protein U0670_09320 [Anaerolineae bacterium]